MSTDRAKHTVLINMIRALLTAILFASPIVIASSALTGDATLSLVGEAAYGDWNSDAPGVSRFISESDLPAPYATNSTANGPVVVPTPTNARLKAPSGFQVNLFASGLDK